MASKPVLASGHRRLDVRFVLFVLAAFVAGFLAGDLIGACRGAACTAPWTWWRTLSDTDQAAWAVAITTVFLAGVAVASPWLTVAASRAAEHAHADRLGVQLAIALAPILVSTESRLRAVLGTMADFETRQGDLNPLGWQLIPGMRIPEAASLASFRKDFPNLGEIGYSLESITSLLQQVDAETASFERAGAAALAPALQIGERVESLSKMLEAVAALVAGTTRRIRAAADAQSLEPLRS